MLKVLLSAEGAEAAFLEETLRKAGCEVVLAARETASGKTGALVRAAGPAKSGGLVGGEVWRVIMENADDGVILLDADYKFFYLSPALRFLLGSRCDSLPGQDFFSQVHPDDAAHAREELSKLPGNPDRTRGFELRLKHKDGHWSWLDVKATNLLDIAPVNKFALHVRDITLRKVAEKAVRASEAVYRKVSESSLNEIMLLDAEGRVLYLNEAASAVMGGRPFLLANRKLDELFAPEKAAEYLAGVREVIAAGRSKTYETVVPVAGTRLYYLLDFQPVQDKTGEFTSVLVINTNITAMRSPRGNKREPAHFRRFTSPAPGLFKTTLEGALVEADESLLAFLGYSSKEELAAAAPRFPDSICAFPSDGTAGGLLRSLGTELLIKTEVRAKSGRSLAALIKLRRSRSGLVEGALEDMQGRKAPWEIF